MRPSKIYINGRSTTFEPINFLWHTRQNWNWSSVVRLSFLIWHLLPSLWFLVEVEMDEGRLGGCLSWCKLLLGRFWKGIKSRLLLYVPPPVLSSFSFSASFLSLSHDSLVLGWNVGMYWYLVGPTNRITLEFSPTSSIRIDIIKPTISNHVFNLKREDYHIKLLNHDHVAT